MTRSARVRLLIIVAAAVTALTFYLWARTKRGGLNRNEQTGGHVAELSPASSPAASPTLAPVPSVATNQSPTPSATQTAGNPDIEATPSLNSDRKDVAAGSFVGTLKLIIPVLGVAPNQLVDTFTDARSEGPVHDAIDIPAPAGTPVVAAADGEIVRLFQSERGGTTIYQLSPDKRLVLYYAHLQRYADGLVAGEFVRQGEVIGYVGDTGNAGAGNFHLHFSISVIADAKRYWEGANINPYPLLRR